MCMLLVIGSSCLFTRGHIGRHCWAFCTDSPFHVLTSLSEKHVNGDEMFCLLQTALSIFFQEAAISSSPQGPGTHFGQVRQIAHHSPCAWHSYHEHVQWTWEEAPYILSRAVGRIESSALCVYHQTIEKKSLPKPPTKKLDGSKACKWRSGRYWKHSILRSWSCLKL